LIVLNHLHSFLKDDGTLIVSIPNGFCPFEIEKFFTEKTGLLKVVLLFMSLLNKIKRAFSDKNFVAKKKVQK